MDWQRNLLRTSDEIQELLGQTQRVAVLGMRSERYPHKPAFYVPEYLIGSGLDVIPVPIHERDIAQILGRRVYRSLAEIPDAIDVVDVFRRAEDIPAHVEDILAKRPTAVWFQSGIRNNDVAEQLARAGIKVVQDRCLMVEHRRMAWA